MLLHVLGVKRFDSWFLKIWGQKQFADCFTKPQSNNNNQNLRQKLFCWREIYLHFPGITDIIVFNNLQLSDKHVLFLHFNNSPKVPKAFAFIFSQWSRWQDQKELYLTIALIPYNCLKYFNKEIPQCISLATNDLPKVNNFSFKTQLISKAFLAVERLIQTLINIFMK